MVRSEELLFINCLLRSLDVTNHRMDSPDPIYRGGKQGPTLHHAKWLHQDSPVGQRPQAQPLSTAPAAGCNLCKGPEVGLCTVNVFKEQQGGHLCLYLAVAR